MEHDDLTSRILEIIMVHESGPRSEQTVENLRVETAKSLGNLIKDIKRELVTKITDELRDAIKVELRTEMMIELADMKIEMMSAITTLQGSGRNTSRPVGDLAGRIPNPMDVPNIIPTVTQATSLDNNPLFKLVNRNIERAQRGEALYSAQELVDLRADRFDKDTKKEFLDRVEEAHVEYDSADSSGEDERWEQLMKDKYNAS